MISCKDHAKNPIKGYFACPGCEVQMLRDEVERIKAENEVMRKNAERYRAIRDDIPHIELGRAILDVQSADEYDAAVDAVTNKEAP